MQPPRPAHQELTLAPEQFAALRDRLARYSGVFLDESRQSVLYASLARRLAATNLSLAAYLALLLGPQGSVESYQLAELVLNHETVFFRNQPHFRALREVVLPELHRRLAPGKPLRIWSAGCATGEEPYSLAMMILETLGRTLPRPVEILATDLSLLALNKARVAIYRGRTLGNIRPELATRYFEQRGETAIVRPEVRSMVTFAQHNLLEPFPAAAQGVDMIFCQNVTIYFQLETCRALMGRFYQALADDGYLFLGFSETLWNVFDGFRSQETAGAFLYRKPREQGARTERRPTIDKVEHLPKPKSEAITRPRVVYDPSPPSPLLAPIDQVRSLLDGGQTDAALEVLRRTPLVGTAAPALLALLARANADKGELDLAVAQARRALELDSLTTEAYILLGMIYARQGQLAEALGQFERARYLDAEAPLIAFHLAETNRQLGKREAALREYRNAARRLDELPPDKLLDGVAVQWLRETCQRNIGQLQAERS